MEQKEIETVDNLYEEITFNKLKELQELINKESALKELCK